MSQAGVAYRGAGVRQATAKKYTRRERAARINRIMVRVTACLVMAFLFGYISRMAVISSNAKEISQIRAEIVELNERQQRLETDLASAMHPQRVIDEANRLGMIRPGAEQVRVISLSGYSASANTQTALDNTTP